MHRNDGGIVDAELIRPRTWIRKYGIQANTRLPINIPELEVTGLALVHSIDDCPEIAMGEGSVITGRFLTREVNIIIRAEIMGLDGTIEILEGTPIHPIWSVDRNDWVPLGELIVSEHLQAKDGLASVVSMAVLQAAVNVYNVEVYGEHVYEVGALGLLVHNTYPDDVKEARALMEGIEEIRKRLSDPTDFLGGAMQDAALLAQQRYFNRIREIFDLPAGANVGNWTELTDDALHILLDKIKGSGG